MEYQVLYRKYRPQIFADIVGQEHVVRTIQNALKEGRVSHAYLFTGPRGTGKTTIARLLAKALNCQTRQNNKTAEPCDTCEHCKDINASRALDLVEIDAASNRGIDDIRNLKESVRFGTTKAAYKVYLVDEAHMLTKEAFNAFLKILEEPPSHVVFVLATTEAHKMPQTIVSRTQRFDFRRLTLGEIVKRLKKVVAAEKVEADKEALQLVAREADGSVRDAESLLGQVLSFSGGKLTLDETEQTLGLVSHSHLNTFVDLVINKEKAPAMQWVQKTVDSGQDLHQFLHSLNRYLRHLLLIDLDIKLGERIKEEVGEDNFSALVAQAKNINHAQVSDWLQIFSQAKQKLEHYPLPQIAIEVALVKLFESS